MEVSQMLPLSASGMFRMCDLLRTESAVPPGARTAKASRWPGWKVIRAPKHPHMPPLTSSQCLGQMWRPQRQFASISQLHQAWWHLENYCSPMLRKNPHYSDICWERWHTCCLRASICTYFILWPIAKQEVRRALYRKIKHLHRDERPSHTLYSESCHFKGSYS